MLAPGYQIPAANPCAYRMRSCQYLNLRFSDFASIERYELPMMGRGIPLLFVARRLNS